MSLKNRLAKLEAKAAPSRLLVQVIREDGRAKPTGGKIAETILEWRAKGIEPRLIQVRIVRGAEG